MNSFINRSVRPPLISPGAMRAAANAFIEEEVAAASTGLSAGSPDCRITCMFCVVMFGEGGRVSDQFPP